MSRQSSFVRVFRVEMYAWDIYLFLDRAKWARFTQRRTGLKRLSEVAHSADGVTVSINEDHACYVGVFDGSFGSLSHEAVHIATAILTGAGIKYDKDNDEPLAYLVGYLVQECAAELLRNRA